jgi:peroxiredoxin
MPRVSKTITTTSSTKKPSSPAKKTTSTKATSSKKAPVKKVKVSKIPSVAESVQETFIKEPELKGASDSNAPIPTTTAPQSSDKTVLIIGSVMLLLGLGLGYMGSQLTSSKAIQAPTAVAKQAQQVNPEQQLVGQLAPDFTLADTTGKSYTLSSYKGKKPVLLVIEATWCGYCKKEAADLEAFYNANKETIEVLTVANREDIATVKAYVTSNGIKHPWMPDEAGSVGSNLFFQGTPHHVLVDKNGIVKLVRPGFATRAQLDAMLSMI